MNIEISHHKTNRWLPNLILLALALAMLTVVLSSYVRLAESGVGCEPWPSCYGQYQNNENARGVNVLTKEGSASSFRLERITHRIVTSSLGLIIFILFILSRSSKYSQLGKRLPTALLVVTVFLAAIGPFHPSQPLPILLLSNFVGGLLLLVLLYCLYRGLSKAKEIHMETALVPFLRIGMFLILVQIFWGGWSSANFTGSSCESLLNCNFQQGASINVVDAFNPINFLELDANSKVILENKMTVIQWIHHFMGVITLVYFILIVLILMRSQRASDRRLAKDSLLILSLVVVQFLLGISSLLVQLPIFLVLSHNFLSAVLLIFMTSLSIKLSGRRF